MRNLDAFELRLWVDDPYLEPYKKSILERYRKTYTKKLEITGYKKGLYDSVNSHLFYGAHKYSSGDRVFREWAPNAKEIFLIGDFNNWEPKERFKFKRLSQSGDFELNVDSELIKHKDIYKLLVVWDGGSGERLPAYATRTVQDPDTKIFSAQIWDFERYEWKFPKPRRVKNPLIYEAHIGMSGEQGCVSDFNYFREVVLPKVHKGGYNTIQLMALQEHPYYGSFGYQVSSFFALSSRFGTPEEFKMLVDKAHSMGIAVIMDLVHSHAVSNVLEGLSQLDGTEWQYFHAGEKGDHPSWGSKCFDYGKDNVIHFLLSNCKFWMETYNLDGFRFDGVTSMIYKDHGLGREFSSYADYFNDNIDEDALTYLSLANLVIKEVDPHSITIAEEVSGFPGLASAFDIGGIGFDFRMNMGIADNWIKWIKEIPDESWHVGDIFYTLTNKRDDEKTISYCECHDQALVGDKTIIFRLIDSDMYCCMSKELQNLNVQRGVALHKMIRLITLATSGGGYLNFMGNEFGHPEWIDFPREGNNWSYSYARRQWSLSEDNNLLYHYLLMFDIDMISTFKESDVLNRAINLIYSHNERQLLIFMRGDMIFMFNFSPQESYSDLQFYAPKGRYRVVLNSDSNNYEGFGRNDDSTKYVTNYNQGAHQLSVYLPSRCAIVLKKDK